MFKDKSPTPRRMKCVTLGGMITAVLVLALAEPAWAIPVFSRKYRTSCITCHSVFPKLTDVGEAFRRNGYQFPSDDDILVKDEPVKFGGDAYKDMFPNSVWPSDMSTLPPIFVRAQLREIFHTDPQGLRWDQDFPHEVVLGGAGTFGPDISAWWEIEWEPKDIEEEGAVPNVERLFIQFSNLFAWDAEEDDNGMHLGNRWLVLPKHALNVRLGKMEPQVLPHYVSQHARVSIEQGLPNRQRYFGNRFRFEPAQSAAVEAHGILRQYTSYVVGFANGGTVSGGQGDDNDAKDVYFRVARKWFGYPLDGEIGSAESSDDEPATGGQDEDVYSPGLDWYRALGVETGFFGWWGWAEIPDRLDSNGGLIFPGRQDAFRRIGFDSRLQWFNLDLYGVFYWGHDRFAGTVGPDNAPVDLLGEDHFSYLVQADYMVKPWILAYLRYEQTWFDEVSRKNKEEARIIPGAVFAIRQNLKLQAEWVLDTTGMDTGGRQATDQLRFQLDWAY